MKKLNKEKQKQYIEIMDRYREGKNNNDSEMVNQAVEDMLKCMSNFVRSVMKENFSDYIQKYEDDMFQEGQIGILKYIDKFDPEQGSATTWFTRPIIHEISEFVNKETNRTTAHHSHNQNKIRKAQRHFEEQQKVPELSDIVLHTGLSPKVVQNEMTMMNYNHLYYIDADGVVNPDKSLDDELKTKQYKTPEEVAIENEEHDFLYGAIGQFSEIDQQVLDLRYGLTDGEPKSFKTIGEILGISAANVSDRVSTSLYTLKNCFGLAPTERNKENSMDVKITIDEAIEVYATLTDKDTFSVSVHKDADDDDDYFLEF